MLVPPVKDAVEWRKMRQKEKITVALLQLAIPGAGPADRRLSAALTSVDNADLIVLPELWNVGYFDFAAYRDKAEPLRGSTFTLLQRIARDHAAFVLGGTFIEQQDGRLYNTALLFDRTGNLIGIYRKRHLLNYKSRERELLTPGDSPLVVPTEIGTLGTAICYDLRFPELFRDMAARGAEIFLVPAAWPIGRMEAWDALVRARAVENQAVVIACGVAGRGFLGRSMIVDPAGVVRAHLGGSPEVITSVIDLAQLRAFRDEFPAWRER